MLSAVEDVVVWFGCFATILLRNNCSPGRSMDERSNEVVECAGSKEDAKKVAKKSKMFCGVVSSSGFVTDCDGVAAVWGWI